MALDGRTVTNLIIIKLGPQHNAPILGRTFEVRSATGMKPLPAATGDAGSPREIFLAGISDIHCFHASSKFLASLEENWQGGLL